jgi:hypothetical protein
VFPHCGIAYLLFFQILERGLFARPNLVNKHFNNNTLVREKEKLRMFVAT